MMLALLNLLFQKKQKRQSLGIELGAYFCMALSFLSFLYFLFHVLHNQWGYEAAGFTLSLFLGMLGLGLYLWNYKRSKQEQGYLPSILNEPMIKELREMGTHFLTSPVFKKLFSSPLSKVLGAGLLLAFLASQAREAQSFWKKKG